MTYIFFVRNSLGLCQITRERSSKIIKSNDYQFWAAGPRKAAGDIPRAPPIHTAAKKSFLLLQPALRCLCCFRRCEPGIFHMFTVHVTKCEFIYSNLVDKNVPLQTFSTSKAEYNCNKHVGVREILCIAERAIALQQVE
jgi:hypothetical protein